MMSDAETIYNNGRSFLIAADILSTPIAASQTTFVMPIVPAIVDAAFSIELLLKSLYFQENDYPILGHKIETLISEVDPMSKTDIYKRVRSKFIISDEEIDAFIATISNAFVDWRYVHEKTSASIDFSLLKALAEAILELLQSRNPGWTK